MYECWHPPVQVEPRTAAHAAPPSRTQGGVTKDVTCWWALMITPFDTSGVRKSRMRFVYMFVWNFPVSVGVHVCVCVLYEGLLVGITMCTDGYPAGDVFERLCVCVRVLYARQSACV